MEKTLVTAQVYIIKWVGVPEICHINYNMQCTHLYGNLTGHNVPKTLIKHIEWYHLGMSQH